MSEDFTLTMTATNVAPQAMVGAREGDRWDHDTWEIELHFQGRTMTLPFHTGWGLRKDGQLVPPTVGGVLECIALDVSLLQNCNDAADLADETAAEIDGRGGLRRMMATFDAMKDQAERAEKLFGAEVLEALTFNGPDDGWSSTEGDAIVLPDPDADQ